MGKRPSDKHFSLMPLVQRLRYDIDQEGSDNQFLGKNRIQTLPKTECWNCNNDLAGIFCGKDIQITEYEEKSRNAWESNTDRIPIRK